MPKIILAILLVLSTFAVVAHGILVYQLNATQFIIAEEETSDDKPVSKEAKELGKEKITFSLNFYKYALIKKVHRFVSTNFFTCSKGFYDKPYNPPEVI
jgi:hypothetical protein